MQNLQLITRDGVEYITSRALAEYFNKRHDHVLRDIRQMEPKWFEAFKNNTPNLGSCSMAFLQVPVEVKVGNGATKTVYEYALTRDQALYVATKYDDVMRARLVQDWVVTKAQVITNSFKIPQTYSEALRLAADEHDRRLLAEAKNTELETEVTELKEAVADADKRLSLDNRYLTPGLVEDIIKYSCNCSGDWEDIFKRNLVLQGYLALAPCNGYAQKKGKGYFEMKPGSLTQIEFLNTNGTIKWLREFVIDMNAPSISSLRKRSVKQK